MITMTTASIHTPNVTICPPYGALQPEMPSSLTNAWCHFETLSDPSMSSTGRLRSTVYRPAQQIRWFQGCRVPKGLGCGCGSRGSIRHDADDPLRRLLQQGGNLQALWRRLPRGGLENAGPTVTGIGAGIRVQLMHAATPQQNAMKQWGRRTHECNKTMF